MTPDEQEAESGKYVAGRILHLESGRFAFFGSFDNLTGMPRLHIGTWSELEEIVRNYKPISAAEQRRKISEFNARTRKPSPRVSDSDLLDLI